MSDWKGASLEPLNPKGIGRNGVKEEQNYVRVYQSVGVMENIVLVNRPAKRDPRFTDHYMYQYEKSG